MQQGIRTQIFWLVYAYAFLFTSVVAEASNSWFRAGSTSTSEEVNVNVKAELGPLLSEEAEIVTRGDEAYGAATARWQYWAAPDVKAVVVVAREEDVRQTILFANQHNIQWYPSTSTHGTKSTFAALHNAIQISLHKLSSISLSPSRRTVTVGGGVKSKALVSYLWAHGLQTVTGVCECTGVVGVALGGGHGVLQGYYGTVSDQMVAARVMLGNGTVVVVSDEDEDEEHSDLFWGLQGAGHNFGVVIELELRVYDVHGPEVGGSGEGDGKEVWSYEAFTFPADAATVRRVYEIARGGMQSQPEGIFQYGLVSGGTPTSAGPTVLHIVVFHGKLEDIKRYTQGYHDLDPVAVASGEGVYTDVPRWLQSDDASVVCHISEFIPGAGLSTLPVDTKEYNIDALVAAVDKFNDMVTNVPELAGSFFMIEQYPVQGLKKRETDSAALAWREDNLLFAPAVVYISRNVSTGKPNRALDELATKSGEAIRDILVAGAQKSGGSHSYVNYVRGTESLNAIYGEEWRLDKLRSLKRRYDPENRFRYYAPILGTQDKEKDSEGHSEL